MAGARAVDEDAGLSAPADGPKGQKAADAGRNLAAKPRISGQIGCELTGQSEFSGFAEDP